MKERQSLIQTFALVGIVSLSAIRPAFGEIQLDNELALYLPLETDLKDHSSNAYPIEIVGHIPIESEGAYFGGRKDWLEAPFISFNNRPFAVSLWIKETSNERMIGLLEQFDRDQPLHHFHLMLRESRQPYLGFYVMDLVSPMGVSREQEWFHITFQYTGSEKQIWINGRFICSREAPAYEGTTGVTSIGKTPRWNNVSSKDFVGYMREFRIYHRALNRQEIEILAGLNSSETAKSTASAEPGIPELNEATLQQRAAMDRLLPQDHSQPFLQIDSHQVIVNGRPGQVYVLETSTDLNQWKQLARFEMQADPMSYQNPERELSPMQFFRVRVEGQAK